jgi:Domain of unknown function (DUF6265)
MMRYWRMIGAAAILALPARAADPVPLPLPDWLHGAWTETREKGGWADEYWTPPRGDMMIGAARMGDATKLWMFEHTRIVRDTAGGLVFIAQPRGSPPAEFPLVASAEQMLEFANPAHDYPQRIRYWREGKALRARTSLMDGSKAMEWRYQPMGGSAR